MTTRSGSKYQEFSGMTETAGVIGYTVRPPIFGPADRIPLGNTVPPRTQLPREYGPSKILYIQGIQSGPDRMEI